MWKSPVTMRAAPPCAPFGQLPQALPRGVGWRAAARRVLRACLEGGQHLGVSILPLHYYSEIPHLGHLRRERAWRAPHSLHGITGAVPDAQLAFVEDCCRGPWRERIAAGTLHAEACRNTGTPGYGPIEADFLYAFVRRHRPRRVIQIGCGVSTAVMLTAAREGDLDLKITCVDPYPGTWLCERAADGAIELLAKPAEKVALERLLDLGPGDLLFIDSTHAVRPGGEVNQLILEVLPRLAAGTWVHFHDITFPYGYARDILSRDLYFQHESVLLHAYLVHNAKHVLRVALSLLHYQRPEGLLRALPAYRPAGNDEGLEMLPGHFPSSAYLQTLA